MSIGYACLTLGVPDTDLKTCTMKNATPENLTALITHNLHSLENMLQYNRENHISLFRISSDLIPFGSSEVNCLPWETIFQDTFQKLCTLIRSNQIRVSMHPGQYTVLNSPHKDVVERAFLDLEYHAKVLDCLGTEDDCKIILHIGGMYGNKPQAIANFIRHYEHLSSSIRKRVVIENDDRSFTIEDVMEIGIKLGIPVVFDAFHHSVNPAALSLEPAEWIKNCCKTWKKADSVQKIHYSQQETNKRPGSHSNTIKVKEFLEFYPVAENTDIMLEVKDKNLSAVKCILSSSPKTKIQALEQEWSRYKYLVLEASPDIYLQIRSLLKDKNFIPAVEFYSLIEKAIQTKITPGNAVNAAEHVWGYFSELAEVKEKETIQKALRLLQKDITYLPSVKRILWKLVCKHKPVYLYHSYYFLNIYG